MWDRIPLSQPEFRDLSRMQTSFTSVGIWTGGRVLLSLGNGADQVPTLRASASLLATLGVAPFTGRTFTADEDTPTGPRAALLVRALADAIRGSAGHRRSPRGATEHTSRDTISVRHQRDRWSDVRGDTRVARRCNVRRELLAGTVRHASGHRASVEGRVRLVSGVASSHDSLASTTTNDGISVVV